MFEFTFFGIIWIFIVLVIFMLLELKYSLFLLFLSMLLQSNSVFFLNKKSVGPQVITSIIFLLFFWFRRKEKKIKEVRSISFFFLIFLILVILGLLCRNIDDIITILSILMLFIYLLVFREISTMKNKVGSFSPTDAIVKLSWFVLCIGGWQLLIEYGFLKNRWLLRTFIYSDIYGSVVFNTKNVQRFYSIFMEPSYASAFLVGSFFYIWTNPARIKYKRLLLLSLFIAIILTKSSTGYLTFVGVGLFLIGVPKVNNNKKIIFFYFGFISLLLLILFRSTLFQEVIINKKTSASYATRSNWDRWAYNIFLQNKLFGIGFKQQRASSLLITLLAEVGMVGLFFYFLFLYQVLKTSYNLNLSIFLFILSVVINQFIASPDLTFSVFWMGVYLLGLEINRSY